jgi:hypothetical protein
MAAQFDGRHPLIDDTKVGKVQRLLMGIGGVFDLKSTPLINASLGKGGYTADLPVLRSTRSPPIYI